MPNRMADLGVAAMSVGIKQERRADGSIKIMIGRATHIVRTDGEADAFMAGYKLAHVAVSNSIRKTLEINDARDWSGKP